MSAVCDRPSFVRSTRRRFIVGTMGLVAAPSIVCADAANGVALVMGNSRYRWEAPLQNVARDAPDVARGLRDLGLKTELVQDVGKDAMLAALDRFRSAASGADLAVFYFAGHGAVWDRETYLVPVDSDLADPTTVKSLVPVSAIAAATKGAASRLLVFDNCRNSPADGWRNMIAKARSAVTSIELTAAALRAPNTLLVFSTAPGRIALDGPSGENSPFARVFLGELGKPSIDLKDLAPALRRNVLLATDGMQLVWDESTFTASRLIRGQRGSSPAALPSAAASRLLELPKAYAFARQKNLSLPPGLVAIRSANGADSDALLGSYATTVKIRVGSGTTHAPGVSIEPLILVVLAIGEDGVAQSVLSSRMHGLIQSGPAWGLLEGRASKGRIDYASSAAVMNVRWKDSNSGTFDLPRDGWYTLPSSDRFVRLD